ncbi:MAG: hypothetical protein EZS28_027489 [Streblomastix strix]|uniref:Uncharacterized protein n=1 Tax=Streblomastix strix TaxID=222440 RepID=A0A5J4V3D3_9EUKA|nr:MAG: hypothetical protein EZS28_027489 [Streblomastix strix]
MAAIPFNPNKPVRSLAFLVIRGSELFQRVSDLIAEPEEISEALAILTEANQLCKAIGINNAKNEFAAEELSARDLRCISIPYMLGVVLGQLPYEKSSRLRNILLSKQYINEFLNTCQNYRFFDDDVTISQLFKQLNTEYKHESTSLQGSVQQRELFRQKIRLERELKERIDGLMRRLNQQNEIKSKILKENKDEMKQIGDGGEEEEEDVENDLSFSDESELRELRLVQLKLNVSQAFQELECIDREIPILEQKRGLSEEEDVNEDHNEIQSYKYNYIDQQQILPLQHDIQNRDGIQRKGKFPNVVIQKDGSIITLEEFRKKMKNKKDITGKQTGEHNENDNLNALSLKTQLQPNYEEFSSVVAEYEASNTNLIPLQSNKFIEKKKSALLTTNTFTIPLEEEFVREHERVMKRLGKEKEMEEKENQRKIVMKQMMQLQ